MKDLEGKRFGKDIYGEIKVLKSSFVILRNHEAMHMTKAGCMFKKGPRNPHFSPLVNLHPLGMQEVKPEAEL